MVKLNPCEITASITALANIIAKELDHESIAVLAAVLVQLGDTLATIAATSVPCNEICENIKK